MKTDSIVASYGEFQVSFTAEGWFNATTASEKYGKRPVDWLSLETTQDYLAALSSYLKCEKSSLLKTRRGNNGGTWLHPKLAVAFSRWLDADFGVWCDMQIDGIIRGQTDWKRVRHEASATFKVMNSILQQVRAESGKDTVSYHYSNEVLLINWVLKSERSSIDRQALDYAQLDLLAKLEERNAVLIGRDVAYPVRKEMLKQFVLDWRIAKEMPKIKEELRSCALS
jgi:hypothetical protein